MWSPNTSSRSDNKKTEVEDCRCSGGDADAATNSSSGVGGQHQLNTFVNNGKKQALNFGGNLTPTDESSAHKKELISETVDSGFISGPQSNIYQDDEEDTAADQTAAGAIGGGTGTGDPPPATQKYNIAATVIQEEKTVLDSGLCIDEDFHEDDDTDEAAHEAVVAVQAKTQDNQSTVASAARRSFSNDQMLLQQNLDTSMSEWFCNLSLQTDDAHHTTPPQQHHAGVSINNLNAAESRAKTIGGGISHNQHQNSNRQQQAQAHAAANPPPTLTPANAWEQFYQQNDDGDTPMHLGCISGYADVVAALIRMAPHPCLFNIQNDECQTPLHLAALTAQPKILRMLLIAGAEPTIRDRHGNTALHLACISGEEQCVRALTIPISASEINEAHRQYGHRSNDKTVSYLSCARLPSDLEIRNYDGERCVHLAAQAGHIDILRILVLYGADINAREGKSGCTPLHIAIKACNEDLANFLLDDCQKLNLEAATYAGLTAYQVACILNKSQMLNILEKRGAEPLTPPDSDYDSDIETDLDESKVYDRFGDPGYFVNYNGGNAMTVA